MLDEISALTAQAHGAKATLTYHYGYPATINAPGSYRETGRCLDANDFYILCPDNDVRRSLDERRILSAAGDIVENCPALSRWHPDYKQAFAAYIQRTD